MTTVVIPGIKPEELIDSKQLSALMQRISEFTGEAPLTAAEKLDISIRQASAKPAWKIATVKTDYGSVIDFTKLGTAEKEMLLADPTFADSVVHKTWSTHPGGVLLPCKRNRQWTDKEAERLTIWKINREAEKAKRKAALSDVYGVGSSGAGTTVLVADRLQRDAIPIELNPEYAAMAERRIGGDA